MDAIVDRCAALDVHKDTVMACVRAPEGKGGRAQHVREFRTFTAGLRALREWLAEHQVTQVAMEATGVYWKPVWHVLEAQTSWELLLANAQHVKNLPGRKTDMADAIWLCQLLECGLLRGSFIPPKPIAQLRDLTRYRKKLIEERTRETQRVHKLLEDAGIKLDSVVSDVLGKSARAMLEALIAGERDVFVLADLAQTRMRPKIGDLRLALEGGFDDHHALLLRLHLDRIDGLDASIDRLDVEIDRLMLPFKAAHDRLQTIPGVGKRTGEIIVAEIGVDMSRFPTAGHLASWAGMCPGNHESAGKRKTGKARKGDAALRSALVESAWAAARTRTYPGAQYRRLARRFGKKGEAKAAFAVGHTLLVMVWHVLHDESGYRELGADYFDSRNDSKQRERYLIRQLEALGHKVTLDPAA